MNAERLLALYDRIADAPDAVARLRRFILDLAVRGKLVPQDPNDEPASELLKRIAKEKARLVKAGEIRKATPIDPVEPDEVPFELPTGWQWSRLAEVGVLSPRVEASDDLPSSFVPMALIASAYGVENGHEVRLWGEIKKGFTRFAEGDVGLAKITPCFENCKSTVFRKLTGGIGAGTTELHVVRPIFVVAEFVLAFFKSPYFVETGKPRMTGTAGQKRIPTEYFAFSPFPLPPLAEQHRIVAKVDELMALCDRLEAARAEREKARDHFAAAGLARLRAPDVDPAPFADHARFAIENLAALTTRPDQIKALRQTILDLAVRGKLVSQDPNDESVVETLNASDSIKKNEFLRRSVPENVKIPEDLYEYDFPKCWYIDSTASLLRQSIILDVKDGNHGANHPKLSDFSLRGVPFVTASQISDDGHIDFAGTHKLDGAPLRKLRVGFAKIGDVIYTHKGSVGRVALCNLECVLSPQATYYRPNTSVVDAAFLRIAMLSSFFRDQVDRVKRQTTRDFVSIQKQYEFFLPLPPLAEQHRIVAKVDALMALCDRLEASLAAAADTRRRLLDALVAEALAPTAPSERGAVA